MNIHEDYVSFETAKLLKEKGFNCLCHSYFRKDNPNNLIKKACGANWNDEPFFISRPTTSLTMKWLREVYKIEVRSTYDWDKDTWWGQTAPMFDENDSNSEIFQMALRFDYPGKSYEEACEAAIKYCLENLL